MATDQRIAAIDTAAARMRAWEIAAEVPDPEVPVLTIGDLGVLRDVRLMEDGAVEVDITPTYTGCPAMSVFTMDIETALLKAGFPSVRIKTVLSPAWTTDWITEEGRRKLREAGIAPPQKAAGKAALLGLDPEIACPHCGHAETEKLSEFGATACKALYRCLGCREPFEYFKCI